MNQTIRKLGFSSSSIFRVLAALAISAVPLQVSVGISAQQPRPPASRPSARKASPSAPSAQLQRARNVGRAYYEQGKYAEACAEFQKVAASGRALATDHLDLGLALMQANKLDQALGELTTAKQMDPKLVAADYNLGILYKRELRYPDAEAALKRVVEIDPGEPAAWFNLGGVYFAERKLDESLAAQEKVDAMGFGHGQNFYVAALFHTFTLLSRMKRPAEAQKYLKLHEKMHDRVPNISLQNPALEGGKYGAILVPPAPPASFAGRSAAEKVSFQEITEKLGIKLPAVNPEPAEGQSIKASEYSLDYARQTLAPLFGASVATGDYDNDGHPDLYVVEPEGANHLFHNNGDGTFTDVTARAGVAGPGGSVSATFVDYDNCGHTSLFVAGVHGVTVYHNNGDGTFTDVTEKTGLRMAPGLLATKAVLFDADNDGFLDLVVTVYTDLAAAPQRSSFRFPEDFPRVGSRFYRNNGDGTFSDVTASSGLASAKGRMRGAVFADFNNNGYADLLFFRDDGPPLLFANQGEDKFVDRSAAAGAALAKATAVDVQVADFNHDGNFDLALWTLRGYEVLLNRGGGKFEAVEHLPAVTAPARRFAHRGTVADLNGDGFDGLLALDAAGVPHFIANRGGRFQEVPLQFSPGEWPSSSADGGPDRPVHQAAASLIPAWLTDPGKLDLVAIQPDGQIAVFEKQGPPAHWLEVRFNGSKSNAGGVGDIVELKAGNFYKKVIATGGPIRIFTGDLAKVDVVRVTWPNAIVQNTIDAATDKPILVRESERLASSCPFLYVWNGQHYVFFTDILGVAPLGELQPDGTRLKPNPEELVRLGSLHDRNGIYSFQITSEMREVDYVDQVRLLAVDHPAREDVYANEIYSSTPADPALYVVHEKHFPVSAVDDQGHDVLPLVVEADGRYPTDFRRDRILGLADLHTLTLDLGQFAGRTPVALYLDGWVFWTDSNASRALERNHKLEMVAPYLEVRDERGEWKTAIPDMGVPSGTNRTMRVDLTGKFLSSDHHVRIVTNLCVYWDQIFFTLGESGGPIKTSPPSAAPSVAREQLALRPIELPLVSADLHYRGFSAVKTDPEHTTPDEFDYVQVMADAPWNPMAGKYTRYGSVERLLEKGNDHLVVIATGDEITVEFDGRALPPLKPGWKRDFFLDVSGYAKDGEPNTAFSKTVDPMPFRQMSNYPYGPGEHPQKQADYRTYLEEYETRPGYVLISPLAPAVR